MAIAFATYVVVSISFMGFFDKWHLREDNREYSVELVLDGTVIRPVAYRKMLPDIANLVAPLLPDGFQQRLYEKTSAPDFDFRAQVPLAVSGNPHYTTRYYIVFFSVFGAAFLAFGAFYWLGRSVGASPPVAYVAAAAALLAVPLIETKGGYYYDYPEFALFCAFLVAASRRRWVFLLFPLAVLGEWNKETFVAFIPCAWPLLRAQIGERRTAAVLGGCGALALAVFAVVRSRVAHIADPRGSVWQRLLDHWDWFTTPVRVLENDISYGVLMPPGVALLLGTILAGLIVMSWRGIAGAMRQSILIAAAINVPLFLFFCAAGELRNLSMLVPGVVVALAVLFQRAVDPPVSTARS